MRAYLVEPVMRESTKHLTCLTSQSQPPPGCAQFMTTLNMEQPIRLHGGSGRSIFLFLLVSGVMLSQ